MTMTQFIVGAAAAVALLYAGGAHAKGGGRGFTFAGKSMSASGHMTVGTRPSGFKVPHVKVPRIKAHVVG